MVGETVSWGTHRDGGFESSHPMSANMARMASSGADDGVQKRLVGLLPVNGTNPDVMKSEVVPIL